MSNFSPAMAVPMTVKMPEPMTAPIPSAVSDHGPSVFFSECSGSSESLISLSIDLVANSCFRSVSAPDAVKQNSVLMKKTSVLEGTGFSPYVGSQGPVQLYPPSETLVSLGG